MEEISSDNATADIMWSGGWDSTFQLLRLLLIHRLRVRPYYLIDSRRPSIRNEVKAAERIRRRLFEDYPHTRELLAPTVYFSAADVAAADDITQAHRTLAKRSHISDQYERMARFCRQRGIDEMLLSVHQRGGVYEVIANLVSPRQAPFGVTYRLDPGGDEYTLFGCFSMPLLFTGKLEMAAEAKRNGWMDIMLMTWFCHVPVKMRKPCGLCNGCSYTIAQGLGWRIPLRRRILRFFGKKIF